MPESKLLIDHWLVREHQLPSMQPTILWETTLQLRTYPAHNNRSWICLSYFHVHLLHPRYGWYIRVCACAAVLKEDWPYPPSRLWPYDWWQGVMWSQSRVKWRWMEWDQEVQWSLHRTAHVGTHWPAHYILEVDGGGFEGAVMATAVVSGFLPFVMNPGRLFAFHATAGPVTMGMVVIIRPREVGA